MTSEARAIYDVLENRDRYSKDPAITSISDIIKTTGVYGKNSPQAKAIAKDDTSPAPLKKAGVDLDKLKAVRSGVLDAIIHDNSVKDYSMGATAWHGNDFSVKTKGAYKSFYAPGFRFNDPSHDIWGMGSHKKTQRVEVTGIKSPSKQQFFSSHYKYESTTAIGGTLFIKRTTESFAIGYPRTIGKTLVALEQVNEQIEVLKAVQLSGMGELLYLEALRGTAEQLNHDLNTQVDKYVRGSARY